MGNRKFRLSNCYRTIFEFPGLGPTGRIATKGLISLDGHVIIGGTYNGAHLIFGGKHTWIDGSNELRIKTDGTAPTSASDGVTVGSQT